MFERLKSARPILSSAEGEKCLPVCNGRSPDMESNFDQEGIYEKKMYFQSNMKMFFLYKYVLPSFEHLKKVDEPRIISRETESNVAEVRTFTDPLIFLLNFLFYTKCK
jgi:hypothetical protein